jgi:hypothetical protein
MVKVAFLPTAPVAVHVEPVAGLGCGVSSRNKESEPMVVKQAVVGEHGGNRHDYLP